MPVGRDARRAVFVHAGPGDDTSTGSESTESPKEATGGTKESSGDSGGEPASDRTPAGAASS